MLTQVVAINNLKAYCYVQKRKQFSLYFFFMVTVAQESGIQQTFISRKSLWYYEEWKNAIKLLEILFDF